MDADQDVRANKDRNLPSAVTTICPGHLYAIGGWLRADRPSGWIPKNASGWLPVQCYALVDGEAALVIDTGLSRHEEAIREGLASLLGGTRSRSVAFTRRELDTALNLPWIVRAFGIETVRCSGPANPFEFLERMDEVLSGEHIKMTSGGATVEFLTPETKISVGSLLVQPLRPPFRMLATDWYYEVRTRTLFTSDMWAFVTRPSNNGPALLTPTSDDISVEKIVNHLTTKFDFLCGADTRPTARAISAFMAERSVDRICPSYGCVIEGTSAVELLLEHTIEALRLIAMQQPVRALDGFSWSREVPVPGSVII